MNLETVAFNPHTLFEDLMMSVAVQNKKQHQLVLEQDPNIPTVLYGDPNRLRQVILNLVSNAVKFTDNHGRVSVMVRASGKLGKAGHKNVIRVDVTDTGIGLRKDQIDRLFTRFSQGDSSLSRRFGGTGLGLAISKQLVLMMNGEIGVHSEYGKGARFWFTAELQRDSEAESAHSLRRIPPLLRSLGSRGAMPVAIVYYPRCSTVGNVLAWYFERWGWVCKTAATRREFESLVVSHRSTLALLFAQRGRVSHRRLVLPNEPMQKSTTATAAAAAGAGSGTTSTDGTATTTTTTTGAAAVTATATTTSKRASPTPNPELSASVISSPLSRTGSESSSSASTPAVFKKIRLPAGVPWIELCCPGEAFHNGTHKRAGVPSEFSFSKALVSARNRSHPRTPRTHGRRRRSDSNPPQCSLGAPILLSRLHEAVVDIIERIYNQPVRNEQANATLAHTSSPTPVPQATSSVKSAPADTELGSPTAAASDLAAAGAPDHSAASAAASAAAKTTSILVAEGTTPAS